MPMNQTRRRFLMTLSVAGAVSFARIPSPLAAEGSLETTAIRLTKSRGICSAAEYVAEALMRDEGFTDIRYVDASPPETMAACYSEGASATKFGHGAGHFLLQAAPIAADPLRNAE